MENLDQFRKETKEWLEENCPPEMRKPMGPGDVVWGGRNCKFPHPDAKLWLEENGRKRLDLSNLAKRIWRWRS